MTDQKCTYFESCQEPAAHEIIIGDVAPTFREYACDQHAQDFIDARAGDDIPYSVNRMGADNTEEVFNATHCGMCGNQEKAAVLNFHGGYCPGCREIVNATPSDDPALYDLQTPAERIDDSLYRREE